MASIYRAFIEKLGRTSIENYVGNRGDLFYDPDASIPTLKVSDGVTPGGVAYQVVGGSGEYNQDSFRTIKVDSADDVVADTQIDTLELVAGSNMTITTDAINDKITFASTDTNTGDINKHSFKTIKVDSADDVVADSDEDTLEFVAGSNITITTDAATDKVTFATTIGGEDNKDSFKTIKVDTRDDIVADSDEDTLEFVAGSNMTITTDATNDKITFTSTDTNTTYFVGDGGLSQYNLTYNLKTSYDTAYGWGNHASGGYLTSTGVLSSHTDVHTTAATNGQVLTWVNANSRWEPAAATGGGGGSGEANENSFETIKVNGADDVVADSHTDTLELVAGSGMSITTDATNDKITFVSTGGSGGELNQNAFSTIDVSPGSEASILATSTTDTLEIVAGANITLTTSGSALTIVATDTDTTYTVGDGGLTQNNLTNALKTNYDTGYTHSQAAHAPSNAEANPAIGDGGLTQNNLTNALKTNWNTAYGWGDHASGGYLTGVGVLSSHTDVHTTAATNGQVLKWDNENTRWEPADDIDTDTIYTSFNSDFDTRLATKSTTNLSEGTNLYYTDAKADARIGLANLFDLTDVASVVAGDDGKVLFYEHSSTSFKWKTDEGTPSGYNNTNWDTAYGWGDHSGAGYLSSTGVLSSHTDVHTTAATNGQVLKWDNGNTRWAPADDTDTDTIYTTFDSDFDTRLGTKSTTNLAEGTNLYYTDARADARAQLKIDAVIDSAPGALDTLNELAAALGDDANFSTTVTNSIATKEPTITAGTSVQYYRGDKTFQTLNTTAVAEGTNLYYTNARADARIGLANLFDLTDVDTPTSEDDAFVLYYNHGTTSFKWKIDDQTPIGYNPEDWDGAYTHSQATHAPLDAEANVPSDAHDSVYAATTPTSGEGGNGMLSEEYYNGSNDDGVGATLTNDGTQAAFEVDGMQPAVGDRILVKNQGEMGGETSNGIYTVTTLGDGSTNWELTRATDADTSTNFSPGAHVFVDGGVTNEGTAWYYHTDDPTSFTFGDSMIEFRFLLGGFESPEMSMEGDLLYHNGTKYTRLSAGGGGDKVLTMNTGETAPSWETAGGAELTNGQAFSNVNTILSNVTTTTASTKNMFLMGQMSVADSMTWIIAGDGVLQII